MEESKQVKKIRELRKEFIMKQKMFPSWLKPLWDPEEAIWNIPINIALNSAPTLVKMMKEPPVWFVTIDPEPIKEKYTQIMCPNCSHVIKIEIPERKKL